uniref:Uncharacterized protein n=1 Tax=Anguilla anguilla TaxID=7936 RepID=A0A0E9U0N5_ANGAN
MLPKFIRCDLEILIRSTRVLANNRPGVTYIVILSLRNSVGAVQMNHNFSFSALIW